MRHSRRRLMTDINMVPFIDIVLVLLVAFMATAPMIMQGVKVKLPKTTSDAIDSSEKHTLVVSIKEDGTFYLNLGKDQERAVSLQDMIEKVAKVRRRYAKTVVIIKGDANVNYGKVAVALSGLHNAGITDVGLVTDPRDAR